MIDSCRLLPLRIKNSKMLSKLPESVQSSSAIGNNSFNLDPNDLLSDIPCRAFIELILPFSVFISPL